MATTGVLFIVSLYIAALHTNPALSRYSHVCLFPAIQLTLFYGGALRCQTPVSKQALHLLKIFLDTWWCSCLAIL